MGMFDSLKATTVLQNQLHEVSCINTADTSFHNSIRTLWKQRFSSLQHLLKGIHGMHNENQLIFQMLTSFSWFLALKQCLALGCS